MLVRSICLHLFNLFLFASSIISVFCRRNKKENIQFDKENRLTFNSKQYKYPRTVSFGFLFSSTRGIFSSLNSSDTTFSLDKSEFRKIKNKFLFTVGGINFSYNVLFASPFFARNLGVLPRLGINVSVFGQNYLTRFWLYFFPNVGIMFNNFIYRIGKLFTRLSCFEEPCVERKEYYKTFLKLPSGIVHIPLTFEPEVGVFKTIKFVPQIGIGPSLVFLSWNCLNEYFPSDPSSFNKDNDSMYYNYIFDLAFIFKFIIKFTSPKGFKNSFHLEFGYSYNPLILDSFENAELSSTRNGLWTAFMSLNYARNIDNGLETTEFLNPEVETTLNLSDVNSYSVKEKYNKTTMFFDLGIGFGFWYDLISNNEIDYVPCPNIGFSFSMPYLGLKLGNNHHLSFICVDFNEDIWTGTYHNKDHKLWWSLVNNMYVTYNFLNLISDYSGVKFVHKLGVFVPFLTELMTYLDKPSKSYAFAREKIGLENRDLYSSVNDTWLSVLYGRFSYKFLVYLDIFRLAGCDIKCKPFFNSYFYFGLNTILFNRRIDYSSFDNKFDFDIIKFDSLSFGISFRLN